MGIHGSSEHCRRSLDTHILLTVEPNSNFLANLLSKCTKVIGHRLMFLDNNNRIWVESPKELQILKTY